MTPIRIVAAGSAAALVGTGMAATIELLDRQPAAGYAAGLYSAVYVLVALVAVPCCTIGVALAHMALVRVDPSRQWRAWYWALAFGGAAGASVGAALNMFGTGIELQLCLIFGATSGLTLLYVDRRNALERLAI